MTEDFVSEEEVRENIDMLMADKLIFEELLASRGWQKFLVLLEQAEEQIIISAKKATKDVMLADNAMALAQLMQQARLYEKIRNLIDTQVAHINFSVNTLKESLEGQDYGN